MGNFKVRVNSEAESREIQNILESIGFRKWEAWNESGSIGGFIWTDSDMTFCDNKIRYFDESPRKEITLPELRAMVNPMKEYLDKQQDGTYKLIKADGGCADRDWIEIPEGADYYAKDSNNGFNGEFFFRLRSDGFNYGAIYLEGKWMNAAFSVDGQDVLWNRATQPEAEPLVDWSNVINNAQQIFDHENASKSSLNNQYAEIEKVRQDNVNNPQHYNKGGVECIDAIEASMTPEAFKGYLKGNVQKYMWRYEQKGGVESLRKAQWYLERLIASMDS